MNTMLDDDLRERWASANHGEVALQRAQHDLELRDADDDGTPLARSHVGRAHQRLSEAYRLCGMMEEALAHKDSALRIWRAQNKTRAVFLVSLQRALVLAELDDADAGPLMDDLGSELRQDPGLEPYYLDFWLEYDARRRFWLGDIEHAERQLLEALAFRRKHRAIRIVEWTEQAIAKVRCACETV